MAQNRAPKQWTLSKTETINSFENWRQNITYILSLDYNFAGFLVDGFSWQKKTSSNPLRGLTADGENVREALRRTAEQKVAHLELMLGQIANFCPVISRNTIVKNSTSITSIWQAIRLHYGFQSSGSHLLDFADIHLDNDERPEDLFQRLVAFVEDNLLKQNGGITHHGETPTSDEDMSPTLENLIVLHWLKLTHPDLPRLVKQRYGTELRSKTLASIKPEISQAMDSLLEEVRSNEEAKIMRAGGLLNSKSSQGKYHDQSFAAKDSKQITSKSCPICKQAGRQDYKHYLSKCKFLPIRDKEFMSKNRQVAAADLGPEMDYWSDSNDEPDDSIFKPNTQKEPANLTRRVGIRQSPYIHAFYNHHMLEIVLDTGAETNMIKAAVARYIGAKVKQSRQTALQADGRTPLHVVGETNISLTRGRTVLYLEALVVENLDVDILAGTPFLMTNDITLRPAKQQVILGNSETVSYSSTKQFKDYSGIRRASAHLLRADSSSTLWPGEYIDLTLPSHINPEETLALEPHLVIKSKSPESQNWPDPIITKAVAGTIRLVNTTNSPQAIKKNEHLCRILPVYDHVDIPEEIKTNADPNELLVQSPKISTVHTKEISLDPDNILSSSIKSEFYALIQEYEKVFDPNILGYNGAVGALEAVVNMGPCQPPQHKGRLPQYPHDKMVLLQRAMDDLETIGVLRKPEELGISVEYVNPSFLIKKPNGTYRLVTAFADVGRYTKPQPSLMPDVDSTLRRIAQWKYIFVMDLKSAFHQIPLAKSSMKYCGVVTPFKGIRVYARAAMGMPGSETALEELMSRVLGDLIQEGIVTKLADDLFLWR